MDENKDFISNEIETENTLTSDTDTYSDENTEYSSSLPVSEEPTEIQAESETSDETKKKGLIQPTIIISLIIVLVTVIGFLVYRVFLNTSVVGVWTINNTATADEATTADEDTPELYLSLESDNKAAAYQGNMKVVGTYVLSETEEGEKNIEIDIPTALTGTFGYTVSGNELTGRSLSLTYGEGEQAQKIDFNSARLTTPEVKPEEGFEPNDKLTGKWTYDDGFNKISYEFKADGTGVFNNANTLYYDFSYTCTDSTITVKFVTYQEFSNEIPYELKDDSIIFAGMQFKADNEPDTSSEE